MTQSSTLLLQKQLAGKLANLITAAKKLVRVDPRFIWT